MDKISDDKVARGKNGQHRPLRPRIPVLLWFALSLWAAQAMGLERCFGLSRESIAPLRTMAGMGAGIVCVLTVMAFLRFRGNAGVRRPRRAFTTHVPMARVLTVFLLCLSGISMGICLSCQGALDLLDAEGHVENLIEADSDDRISAELEMLSDSRSATYGESATVLVAIDHISFRATLRTKGSANPLMYGERFRATIALAEVPASRRQSAWRKGIVADVNLRDIESQLPPKSLLVDVRKRAIMTMEECGGESAGLIEALSVGYRSTFQQQDAYLRFQRTGLAHLVAVSGAHLSLVIGLVALMLTVLRVPLLPRTVLLVGIIGAYLVFSAMPVSAIRAATMLVASLFANVRGRRPASLQALAVCLIVFLTVDPISALSVSLFLSAGSLVGIIVFTDLLASWAHDLPNPIRTWIVAPLCMTFASGLVTLPFACALFSQVPLISPLANVAAAPLFSLACPASLAASFIAAVQPHLAPFAMTLASVPVALLQTAIDVLADVPYAAVPFDGDAGAMVIVSATACGALYLGWPGVRPKTAVLLGAASVLLLVGAIKIAPYLFPDEIIMLDVGQGDAFVVRSRGRTVLIDTGREDRLLTRALSRHGIFHLDAIVLSHADDDHCGSLDALRGLVQVERVLVAAGLLDCSCDKCELVRRDASSLVGENNVGGMHVGDELVCGRFAATVIWPSHFSEEGGNDDSLCLLVGRASDDAGGETAAFSALFCGDAEAGRLQTLIETGALPAVGLLKVGHHGSAAALTPAVMDALRPRIAFIGVGADNRYGHPAPETLAVLETSGCRIFRTDEHGDVSMRFPAEGAPTISCLTP